MAMYGLAYEMKLMISIDEYFMFHFNIQTFVEVIRFSSYIIFLLIGLRATFTGMIV